MKKINKLLFLPWCTEDYLSTCIRKNCPIYHFHFHIYYQRKPEERLFDIPWYHRRTLKLYLQSVGVYKTLNADQVSVKTGSK